MSKNKLLILLIFFLGYKSYAQEEFKQLSVVAMTESMAFPFTRYEPIHPGAEVGYALRAKQQQNKITAISLYLGWYYHRRVENAFYVRVEWGCQFKITDFLTADFYSGVGYMHVFYPGEVYELNPSSGEFEKIKQSGKPRALGSLAIGLTYLNQSRYSPFIRQDLAVESPFANGIPVMIHSFLKLGVNIKISKK